MTVIDLKKYKDNLYSSLSRDLSEFEKNFMLISGGILAFTITFIKEIVKIEQANFLVLLYISWGFIIISIGIMMFTFLKSSLASDKLWSVVDDFIISNKLFNDDDVLSSDNVNTIKTSINKVFYHNKKVLRVLRFASVSSFILGVISLALYVSINLTNENRIKSKHDPIIENSLESDTVVIWENNKSIKIIFNHGKRSKIRGSQTNAFTKTDTNDSTETNTSTPTKTDTDTKNNTTSTTKTRTR
jgi:hypothetical protein